MSLISILVATTSPDIMAEAIAESVAERPDMRLLEGRVVRAADVNEILRSLPRSSPWALVLVGRPVETSGLAQQFLAERAELIVLQVDIIGDNVQIGLRDPRLQAVLDTLRDLAERTGPERVERMARVRLETDATVIRISEEETGPPAGRPVLRASYNWVLAVLRDAVERVPESSEMHGLTLSRATVLQSLATPATALFADDLHDAALRRAVDEGITRNDPLSLVVRVLGLSHLEFRLLLLALAPELDERFQRCYGFLLNDMSRRSGTMGLVCGLLGVVPEVCADLAENTLVRWLAFEHGTFSADDPLRLDPHLVRWILGDGDALARDPRVRRALRLLPWPGASILGRDEESGTAAAIRRTLRDSKEARWLVLGRDDPANWRAILELCTTDEERAPIRVEMSRLAAADPLEIEDCALRLGRMALLTDTPLVIDLTHADEGDEYGDRIESLLGTLDRIGCGAALIGRDEARIVRQLGPARFDIVSAPALSPENRIAAVRSAAGGADTWLSDEAAESLSRRFPLSVDALEQAMRLARSRPLHDGSDESRIRRFTAACRERAVEGLSHLAERIEPVFRIEDVVLPPERKRQLVEIVDHVRLAPKVLDDWKFGDQLPYGRGVTALFFGPSGTGKTMAAMGIAQALGVQLLRLDLSRVVSKYIGDTEKNIDRVFRDAQRSGSAILIDEADALFGKRSEVKDAHDRYANIEVAFLLQRMEAYEGLAILTSNMRQNLDSAFLRRLRFLVEFPRPDAAAREQIWRFCLPDGSHELDQAAFRQLARKIDMTGGHIRQIALRAAFIAAAADVRINLEHIADAARAEFAKLGLPPVELDLNGRRAA